MIQKRTDGRWLQAVGIYRRGADGVLRTATEVWRATGTGLRLLWQAVRSCFGSGLWKGAKPWLGSERWRGKPR